MLGLIACKLIAISENGAANLGFIVLEREIPMPGAGTSEAGYLARYPDQLEMGFKQAPRICGEFRDREVMRLRKRLR